MVARGAVVAQIAVLVALLVGQSSAADIALGAFLNLNADLEDSKEVYMYHAYRMALAEHASGSSFSEMTRTEGQSAISSVLIEADNTLELKISNFSGSTTLYLDFIDTTGMSETQIKAAMNTWIDTTRAGFNQFILGGHSSSSEKIKAELCKSKSVIFISPGAATESIFTVDSGKSSFAFGILSSTSLLGSSTMNFLNAEMSKGTLTESKYKIALLYENAAHGRDYRDAILEFADSSSKFEVGIEQVFEFQDSTSDTDFRAYTDELMANVTAKVGDETNWLLLIDAHSDEFVSLQRSLAHTEHSFEAISFGARGTDTVDLERILQGAESETDAYDMARSLRYVFAGVWWSPGQQTEATKKFVTAWRKHEAQLWLEELENLRAAGDDSYLFREPSDQLAPAWFGATGYDAMCIILDALLSSKSGDPADDFTTATVRTQLERTAGFTSLLPGGKIKFPSSGARQATNGFSIAQNQLAIENTVTAARTDITLDELFPFITYPDDESAASFRAMPSYSFTRPDCSAESYQIFLLECNLDAYYDYNIHYFDRDGNPCPVINEACYCEDNDPFEGVRCEYVPEGSSRAIIIETLAFFGVALGLLILVILFNGWKHELLRTAHRIYYLCIVLCCTFTNLAAISLVGETTEHRCKRQIGFLVSGFGVTLSLFMGRVYYWYRVWAHPTKENLRMSNLRLWWLPVASSLGTIIMVTVGVAANDTFIEDVDLGYELEVPRATTTCSAGSNGYSLALGAYYGLAIFATFILCYQAKEVDGKYYDSRYLWMAMLNTAFVGAILGILFGLVNLDAVDIEVCIAVSVLWVTTGILILLASIEAPIQDACRLCESGITETGPIPEGPVRLFIEGVFPDALKPLPVFHPTLNNWVFQGQVIIDMLFELLFAEKQARMISNAHNAVRISGRRARFFSRSESISPVAPTLCGVCGHYLESDADETSSEPSNVDEISLDAKESLALRSSASIETLEEAYPTITDSEGDTLSFIASPDHPAEISSEEKDEEGWSCFVPGRHRRAAMTLCALASRRLKRLHFATWKRRCLVLGEAQLTWECLDRRSLRTAFARLPSIRLISRSTSICNGSIGIKLSQQHQALTIMCINGTCSSRNIKANRTIPMRKFLLKDFVSGVICQHVM
ncbi:Hypothetical Protein FCC1311_046182 [Hondaea fermentalgiana]|uniref:G-protein coupled receptors family 3 profile domain-containing protein n=1 Tax=Hondaea fermentalgiana TaxID=2315210 RepID=A0A2R5GCU3_9STRA|nr:Hypothetical Protein FCC1311_046182 [Hondaea fermentalgiana]|eukprot:GBG28395.1 Hypothetical Protein FCC1311_046182 [Hondaea fermentalgiana]